MLNKKVIRNGIGAALLISMLALTGCGGPGGAGGPGGMPGAMPDMQTEASTLTVKIENPVQSTILLTSKVVGTVQPQHTAEVFPKGSGTVTGVYFETGDYVEEGQILASLDSDSLNAAQINIENAQLQLETAQKDLERKQMLYEVDGVTKQALESAENSVKSAELQLRSAQDNYNTLSKNVNITAPISGIVESRDVEVYDNASMQQAICTISQKSSMQVKFQVPERVKSSMAAGDQIGVEKNGTVYNASVTEISSKTDDNSGLFEICATIENGKELSTGSRVTVELVTDRAEDVLCIPIDAVYYDNGEPYVFVSNNGIAEVLYIETGIYNEEYMQVVSGLNIASDVITSWSSQLVNGTAVQSVDALEQMPETDVALPEGEGPGEAMPEMPAEGMPMPEKPVESEA